MSQRQCHVATPATGINDGCPPPTPNHFRDDVRCTPGQNLGFPPGKQGCRAHDEFDPHKHLPTRDVTEWDARKAILDQLVESSLCSESRSGNSASLGALR